MFIGDMEHVPSTCELSWSRSKFLCHWYSQAVGHQIPKVSGGILKYRFLLPTNVEIRNVLSQWGRSDRKYCNDEEMHEKHTFTWFFFCGHKLVNASSIVGLFLMYKVFYFDESTHYRRCFNQVNGNSWTLWWTSETGQHMVHMFGNRHTMDRITQNFTCCRLGCAIDLSIWLRLFVA